MGRVTVLAQLKVDRLCSVVDRTADFDPKLPHSRPADQSLETLAEVPYKRREHDAEDMVLFCAPRLYESGLIKANPNKIIAEKTDWRFFNELKRELKA